ncbi:MAG: Hpt domain-containing protein [Lachnospiraceae bacterium]|nr:Hpt domain-containing protein [Lachnospiraceae bacterium]MDE7435389.1 Hpt domain-containing protein [Lachnospiraceae bacterium]
MNEKLEQELRDYGLAMDETLARFAGNKAMLLKFLLKFKDDPNYAQLNAHLEEGNYTEAYKSSHTIKGVAANLGLDPIRKPSSELTELMRNKQPEEVDPAQVEEQWKELKKQYARFVEIVETCA